MYSNRVCTSCCVGGPGHSAAALTPVVARDGVDTKTSYGICVCLCVAAGVALDASSYRGCGTALCPVVARCFETLFVAGVAISLVAGLLE